MVNTSTIDNSITDDTNLLLLNRVRVIIKFYIWPLLTLFGVTGNCLAILVLSKRRLRRTSTNNYLTILALFDSCYLISSLLLNFGSHPTFSENSFIKVLLLILRPIADFSSNTATWLIVCFTIERTLAVARPIYAKRIFTVRRSRHLMCILIVMCFLITLPICFEKQLILNEYGVDISNRTVNKSIIKKPAKQKPTFLSIHRLYLVSICVLIVWIPLIILSVCNSILICYVHRSRHFDHQQLSSFYDSNSSSFSSNTNKHDYFLETQRIATAPCSPNTHFEGSYSSFHLRRHHSASLQKRRVTIVLIICLFVALLLWTPQSLSLTYETLIESYIEMSKEHQTILLIFNNFANLFVCINASIDFILYCFLSEKFARTFRQIVVRRFSTDKTNFMRRVRMKSSNRTSFIFSNAPKHNAQRRAKSPLTAINNYSIELDQYRCSSLKNGNK